MRIGSSFSVRARAFVGIGALLLSCTSAFAQATPPAQQDEDVLAGVSKWLDRQAAEAKDAFDKFGHDAGVAARNTADSAKDAADTLVKRLPATTLVAGHEVCKTAPNGAPDCVTAATSICQAKGFRSGKSVDMTTAENCPAKVYLAGRSTGPECRNETFVSSALCQ